MMNKKTKNNKRGKNNVVKNKQEREAKVSEEHNGAKFISGNSPLSCRKYLFSRSMEKNICWKISAYYFGVFPFFVFVFVFFLFFFSFFLSSSFLLLLPLLLLLLTRGFRTICAFLCLFSLFLSIFFSVKIKRTAFFTLHCCRF
jgi:hypothetical protein